MLTKNRIEAFSDGVIAIIITIMVFDLKVQDSATGKRYVLLKNEEVVEVFVMDNKLTDNILNAIEENRDED